MENDFKPDTDEGVHDLIRWASAESEPIEIVGHGSKRGIGKPTQTARTLDLSRLTGVTLFEPEELVLSAKAGTPLTELHHLLAEHNQEFQFEPADLGPLLGLEAGDGTLGGLVSTNFAGPRRLKSGSVRDHILGLTAVSGRGEVFKTGGRVVKNVTGYDLAKGLTGAWGTLAVITDITMKVLPKAETEQTLVLTGLSGEDATEAMALAMGSSAEVSAAAYLPDPLLDAPAAVLLRLEGVEPSVRSRLETLHTVLQAFGEREELDADQSKSIWQDVRDVRYFVGRDTPVWRVSCTPTSGTAFAEAVANKADVHWYADWQGGLIWLECRDGEAHDTLIRRVLAAHGGGHATLVRAKSEIRRQLPVFQPLEPALAALSERYRSNFDPRGILNPGRLS